MTYAAIAVPWVLVLLLTLALLVGQPAVVPALEERVAAQSTEVARYRATIQAIPQPTAQRSVCAPRPTC